MPVPPLPAFQLARIPPVHFGPGKLAVLSKVAAAFASPGGKALVVTGASSLKASGRLDAALEALASAGIAARTVAIEGEPSTDFIDSTCAALRGEGLGLVIGIGGGSVIDGAKALSAMLPHGNSVLDHLEDVGRDVPHSGRKLPYVAVPTTSGTGGEMTKNAVLSAVGPAGYKKSLRHDAFIPDAVIVDPELMLSCPPDVTAACGMDAFTQLLEPYLSPAASPVTDALVLGALEQVRDNLVPACGAGAGDVRVRGGMAYASMISGIALANAGLGIVHGLASPLGGFFPVPHGVVCGTLVAAATAANVRALREALAGRRAPPASESKANQASRDAGAGAMDPALALSKYARVGRLFGGREDRDDAWNCDHLSARLAAWTGELGLPRLGRFGVREADLDRVAEKAGNRNNPVRLRLDEIRALVAERL
jgi:alcohol dehydrogenase